MNPNLTPETRRLLDKLMQEIMDQALERAQGQLWALLRNLGLSNGGAGPSIPPTDAHYVTTQAEAGLASEVVLGTGVIMTGTAGARPAAGTAGRLYYATDTHVVSRDNGASWDTWTIDWSAGVAAKPTLDTITAPAADVSLNGHKLTSLAAPTSANDAARKTDVDAAVAGLAWKASVRVASTVNGTLATAFANSQVVDGVTLATGDRILLKNQTSGAENGVYTVNASGAPTRATDADAGVELVNAAVFVSEGTAQADTLWVCTTNATITVGATSLTFVQFGTGTSGAPTDATYVTRTANGTLSAEVLLSDVSASELKTRWEILVDGTTPDLIWAGPAGALELIYVETPV